MSVEGEVLTAVYDRLARVRTATYGSLRERWLAAHDLYKLASPFISVHYALWCEVAAAEEAAWRDYRASLG